MKFRDLAEVEEPGRDHLPDFVYQTLEFLKFVVEDPEERFAFLWNETQEMRSLARETFKLDVLPAGDDLIGAIDEIDDADLVRHGLVGRPMRFKLQVIASIARGWKWAAEHSRVRPWLLKMIDAIDAVLDSLISAAAGPGALIKEFKDALRALAGER